MRKNNVLQFPARTTATAGHDDQPPPISAVIRQGRTRGTTGQIAYLLHKSRRAVAAGCARSMENYRPCAIARFSIALDRFADNPTPAALHRVLEVFTRAERQVVAEQIAAGDELAMKITGALIRKTIERRFVSNQNAERTTINNTIKNVGALLQSVAGDRPDPDTPALALVVAGNAFTLAVLSENAASDAANAESERRAA